MALLDALVVLVVAALLVYAGILRLTRATDRPDARELALGAGQWRTAHYESHGHTRVVLQRLTADGSRVVDEHVVATIRADDPDYEDTFLTAMLTARQRQALFESEDE